MRKGILFVISAPSGTGKTTLLKQVMAAIPNLGFSVSHTTRQPREGEQPGVDYHFVDHQKFKSMIEAEQFLEWAEVHGNFYGTSIGAVADKLEQGIDVILDIDVQGAAILRDDTTLDAVHVFIAPPSIEQLEQRLRGRNTEDEQTIQLRLSNSVEEMKQQDKYHYLVINDQLEEAATVLSSIFIAERARTS